MEYLFYCGKSPLTAECADDRWALRHAEHCADIRRIVRAADNVEIWPLGARRPGRPGADVANEVADEVAVHEYHACPRFSGCTHSKRSGFMVAVCVTAKLADDEKFARAAKENIHARGHAIVQYIRNRLHGQCAAMSAYPSAACAPCIDSGDVHPSEKRA